MVELLCSGVPFEIEATALLTKLQEALTAHPKACIRTALVLEEGSDYVRPKGSDRCEVLPEWLVGRAKSLWDKCAGFEKRWIDFRLSPQGLKSFAIAVHANHNEKILCGSIVANEIDQQTARKAARLRRRPNLVVVFFGNNADDESYRHELFKHAERLGVQVMEKAMPEKPTPEMLRAELHALNRSQHVDALLVQTIRDDELNKIIRSTLANRKDRSSSTSRIWARPWRPVPPTSCRRRRQRWPVAFSFTAPSTAT